MRVNDRLAFLPSADIRTGTTAIPHPPPPIQPMFRRTSILAVACAISLSPAFLQGQSTVVTKHIAGEAAGAGAASINSPWVGAQVAYRFGEASDAADHLLVTGSLIRDVTLNSSGTIHLPVAGNVASLASALAEEDSEEDAIDAQADRLLLSSEGVNVGVYPYYELPWQTDHLLLTVHGVAAWRMNALRAFGDETPIEEAERIYLHQGRFAAGVDMLLGDRTDGRAAILLSAAMAYRAFSADTYERAFGERKSGFGSVELVGVLPLLEGTGLLFEGVLGDGREAFRVGIMLSGSPGSGT